MEESERVQCRRCRRILLSKDEFCLLDAHGEEYHNTTDEESESTDDTCPSVREHNCLYLSEESFPDFILNAVDESSWTKGKINCPGCQARLGSFNFVSGSQCVCGSFVLPQVHILSSKIDWMKVGEALPRPVSYPNQSVSLSPDTITFPIIASEKAGSSNIDANTATTTTTTNMNPPPPPLPPSLMLDDPGDSTQNYSRQRRVRCRQLTQQRRLVEEPEEGGGGGGRDELMLVQGAIAGIDGGDDGCAHNNNNSNNSAAAGSVLSYPTATNSSSSLSLSTSLGCFRSVSSASTSLTAASAPADVVVDIRPSYFDVLRDEVSSSQEDEDTSEDDDEDDDEDDEEDDEGEEEEETVIPDRLTCPVCLDLLYSPLVTNPCCHTFCEPCLRRIAKPDPTNTQCPLCRQVIGNCNPIPELGSEARERFPEIYKQRRQFEIQHNSHHLPLPWLRNFRLRGMYEEGQSWVERAGGWQTVAVMMSLNILGIGLLLYLGRPVRMEPDPHLYPASTRSWHQPQ